LPTFGSHPPWGEQPPKNKTGAQNTDISKLDAIEFFTSNSIHTADRRQLVNG
jgi:hypothetical protein